MWTFLNAGHSGGFINWYHMSIMRDRVMPVRKHVSRTLSLTREGGQSGRGKRGALCGQGGPVCFIIQAS